MYKDSWSIKLDSLIIFKTELQATLTLIVFYIEDIGYQIIGDRNYQKNHPTVNIHRQMIWKNVEILRPHTDNELSTRKGSIYLFMIVFDVFLMKFLRPFHLMFNDSFINPRADKN